MIVERPLVIVERLLIFVESLPVRMEKPPTPEHSGIRGITHIYM